MKLRYLYREADTHTPSTSAAPEESNLTGVFEIMAYEDQPEILKKDSKFRRRAQKAIAKTVIDAMPIKEGKEEDDIGFCCCMKSREITGEGHLPATKLTPQLEKASSQGFNMMKKLFFPALPHLLQDAWVYLEFGITMFAFVFGLLSLDLNDGSKAFNIVYLTLTIISIALAIIDCFIYFVQMGSCAECLKICYVKLKKGGEETLLAMEDGQEEQQRKGWCRMSQEKKEKFSTYFELVRNIISEAILYPLLICDLFDFIVGGVFRNISTEDHLNFTLFVIGSLYLILAVYIMRMFTIIGVIFSFRRIPEMPNSSQSRVKNIQLLKWFSIHILFQILTHALLIVSVALKIRQENPNFGEQDTIFASSFLWINVVLGGLIPFVGILSFFVTNYYDIKEFSIGFWIDMMAMLQAPSFTEVVFPCEDGKSSEEMARDLVQDSQLKLIHKEYKRYRSPAWYKKFFFPLKLPVHMIIGSLFVSGLFVFLVSLILTQDPTVPDGPMVKVILLKDMPITVAFFVCLVLLFLFNVRIIILMLVFFTLSISYLLFTGVFLTIILPYIVFVHIPVGFCIGVCRLCRSVTTELSVFSSTGPNVDYFTI